MRKYWWLIVIVIIVVIAVITGNNKHTSKVSGSVQSWKVQEIKCPLPQGFKSHGTFLTIKTVDGNIKITSDGWTAGIESDIDVWAYNQKVAKELPKVKFISKEALILNLQLQPGITSTEVVDNCYGELFTP